MSHVTSSVPRQRLRIVALVAVLLAFDAAFVVALYVLGHIAVALAPIATFDYHLMTGALRFDYLPLWPVVAVGTPLVVLGQSVFGYRTALRDVRHRNLGGDTSPKNWLLADRSDDEADDPDPYLDPSPALQDRVRRLAQTADVATPDVRVIESSTPNSFVVSRPGERTLFVTSGLTEALDGAELDAVLAHELAHLKNGDAVVMTAAAFLPAVTERVVSGLANALRGSLILGWALADRDDGTDQDGHFPQGEFFLAALSVVALPTMALLHACSTACYRLLSRIREYAADAGGVAITGSPAAMADALATLTLDARPETDLRAETGVRELCVLPYGIEADDGTDADDPEHLLERLAARWNEFSRSALPGSHPDPETRIDALRDRQR